jgi:nitroreductase
MRDAIRKGPLPREYADQLFYEARTHVAWLHRPVPDELLRTLYGMAIMGPTSANCLPLRLVFVRSPQAKAKLVPLMAPGNQDKTRHAPVTAILAYDLAFYDKLPQLYPHEPAAASWFNGSKAAAREAALRNSSLQGGYFIIAARALGLDCGPMGGFDAQAVAQAFFPEKPFEVNFICNLGYGDGQALHPRLPRPGFDEACSLA